MTTPTILSLPSSVSSLASEVPKLCATNWMEFKQAMEMLFIGAGADYLNDSTPSTSIPFECSKLDKQLIFTLWSRVDDEFRYIVQDNKSSTLLAWTTLTLHFQKSTMPRRITARQQLYSVVHDTDRSIDVFIHSVTSAAKALADLGHKVADSEIKDILLMKLDDSYAIVRTSIMTAKEEPDLATVKALLSSASDSFPLPSTLPTMSAMSASTGYNTKKRSSYPSSQPAGPVQDSSSLPTDDKGYQWCNNSNQDACHRCGRANHIAAYCIFTMPVFIKDWVMRGGYKENANRASTLSDDDFAYESAGTATAHIEDPPDLYNRDMSNTLGLLHI